MVKSKTDPDQPVGENGSDLTGGVESAGKSAETRGSGKSPAARNGEAKKTAPVKKAAARKPAVKNGEKEPGLMQKIRQFFREVRIELKKVTWPSRKETIASTSVVLVLVFLVAVYLGLIDFGLNSIVKMLIK